MAASIHNRLLRRVLGEKRSHRSVSTLYGDKLWAEDLDIVNELGGHTGCVNALSWSAGGELLASGSDDTHLNIWSYNPVDQARPFTLNTSVSTGHHANIFSVKFMPHSNDSTIVTCAGDSEVRVFDLEYGGANQTDAIASYSASTRSHRFNNFFSNARWMSDADTNARVYRSHADRAKRVVTESSPFLFLTCSEDGEVRQWDLRLPSSAYPAPRGGRGYARFRRGNDEGSDNVPAPLISYKRYAMDLNSISCSANQPHYIALGGAHLHCFLHDRRMLGRDLHDEAGKRFSSTPIHSSYDDDVMAQATQCVKRFAPNGKRRMSSNDRGHITACKISDAYPNELVASWSGDHVYSFDIVKGPDARDVENKQDEAFQRNRLKNQSDRKRKRKQATTSSSSQPEHLGPVRRLRRASESLDDHGHALVINQGAQEDNASHTPHDLFIDQAQTVAERVARSLVRLRKTLFDFSAVLREENASETVAAMESSNELTPRTKIFTEVLGQCFTVLPEMETAMSNWSYPMDPGPEDVALQNTLRRNRQSAWRFVQASGCLALSLGGILQTAQTATDSGIEKFRAIVPAIHEGRSLTSEARFCYDFLKAILSWLDGGPPAIMRAFTRPPSVPADSPRFFVDSNDTISSFMQKLNSYLSHLASGEKSIIDLDTNQFEFDERRQVFSTQKAAVQAFTRAVEGIELRLSQGPSDSPANLSAAGTNKRIMDKGAAARFWGVKVGRSLLMEAASGVNFDFVSRAFGALGADSRLNDEDTGEESVLGESTRSAADLLSTIASNDEMMSCPENTLSDASQNTRGEGSTQADTETTTPATVLEHVPEEHHEVEEDVNDQSESEDDEDSDEDEESAQNMIRRRIAFGGRSRERAMVNMNVPYSSHNRVYKGHCNIRTVKDVNYYGLNDEYVVSGSDDGHFFIWDRKTGKIVNILEGDGEVVNVVQGHPYEPLIACSGIDSTIKIFGVSGESRERYNAAQGVDIANPSGGTHSSLPFGRRHRRRAARDDSDDDESEIHSPDPTKKGESIVQGGLRSRKAIQKIYEITSQNDAQRREGNGDAFMTQDMLARFAAALQRGQVQAVAGQPGEGATIVINDQNCEIM